MYRKFDKLVNEASKLSKPIDISKYKDYTDISFTMIVKSGSSVIDKLYKYDGYKIDENNIIYFDDPKFNYIEFSSFKYDSADYIKGYNFVEFVLELQGLLEDNISILAILSRSVLVINNTSIYEIEYSDYIKYF